MLRAVATFALVLVHSAAGGCSRPPSDVPPLAWSPSEVHDLLEVVLPGEDNDWFRHSVRVEGCAATDPAIIRAAGSNGSITKNVPATRDGPALNQPSVNCTGPIAAVVGTSADPMQTGDALTFCAEATSAPTKVRVLVLDRVAATVRLAHVFEDVAPCAQ